MLRSMILECTTEQGLVRDALLPCQRSSFDHLAVHEESAERACDIVRIFYSIHLKSDLPLLWYAIFSIT